MTTTCTVCDFVVPDAVPGSLCPRCGGPTSTDAVVYGATAGVTIAAFPATLRVRSRYAGSWYDDALGEAGRAMGDYHARRREIIFAVCCAESYLYEWAYDLLEQSIVSFAAEDAIAAYFPRPPEHGWNRGVSDQWKEVPKQLHQDGRLAALPDFGGPHGEEWRTVVVYRDGLIHAHISQQEIYAPTHEVRPDVTTSDLSGLTPGWALGVVIARIRRLHAAAGTPPPEWLSEQ